MDHFVSDRLAPARVEPLEHRLLALRMELDQIAFEPRFNALALDDPLEGAAVAARRKTTSLWPTHRSRATSSRTPDLRKASSARYMIFCGAPPHLIGVSGMVKTALPPRKLRMQSQVYSTC